MQKHFKKAIVVKDQWASFVIGNYKAWKTFAKTVIVEGEQIMAERFQGMIASTMNPNINMPIYSKK